MSTVSPAAPPLSGGHRPCALTGRGSDQFQSRLGARHSFTCFQRPNGLLHGPGQQDGPSDPGDGSPTWHPEVSRCCLLFRSCCGSSRPADLDLLLKEKVPFPPLCAARQEQTHCLEHPQREKHPGQGPPPGRKRPQWVPILFPARHSLLDVTCGCTLGTPLVLHPHLRRGL